MTVQKMTLKLCWETLEGFLSKDIERSFPFLIILEAMERPFGPDDLFIPLNDVLGVIEHGMGRFNKLPFDSLIFRSRFIAHRSMI